MTLVPKSIPSRGNARVIKIGLIYPQTELNGDPEAVRRIAPAAEDLGFDYLLASDHVLGASHDRKPKLAGPYTEHHPFHDPLVMFSYVAALTKRLEFATGVLILPQRQTALVARQAADVDLLSDGRLTLGVGTGWNYVEYDVLGQEFETRGKRMDEQITFLRQLWTDPLVSFGGAFDKADRVALNPRPHRRIPILLGGFADIALRRAARVGDGFIFADGAADAFAQVVRLRELLAEGGRGGEPFELRCNGFGPAPRRTSATPCAAGPKPAARMPPSQRWAWATHPPSSTSTMRPRR